MLTILNFEGRSKKLEGRQKIFARGLWIWNLNKIGQLVQGLCYVTDRKLKTIFLVSSIFRESRQCHIVGLRIQATINTQNLNKIVRAIFEIIEILNFFLCELPLILGVARKQKKQAGDICRGTPDIEFEQDWSVGLDTILADGQKIKQYFCSFRDFSGKSRQCHIVGLRMFYKPTKVNQNRSHFSEIRNFNFFIM